MTETQTPPEEAFPRIRAIHNVVADTWRAYVQMEPKGVIHLTDGGYASPDEARSEAGLLALRLIQDFWVDGADAERHIREATTGVVED